MKEACSAAIFTSVAFQDNYVRKFFDEATFEASDTACNGTNDFFAVTFS